MEVTPVEEEVSQIIVFGKVCPFSPTVYTVTYSIAVLHLG